MDVKELLEKHENLGNQLEKIPRYRKITYKEEMENGKLIGKPRFMVLSPILSKASLILNPK